jgi:hypothetical protein
MLAVQIGDGVPKGLSRHPPMLRRPGHAPRVCNAERCERIGPSCEEHDRVCLMGTKLGDETGR